MLQVVAADVAAVAADVEAVAAEVAAKLPSLSLFLSLHILTVTFVQELLMKNQKRFS